MFILRCLGNLLIASKYADEAMSEAKRIMEKRTSTRVVA